MNIRDLAEQVQPYVVECRRTIHRWPETAMEEFKTTEFICKELDGMGIPYRRTVPTGCIAEIKGDKPGRTIALRADIDALKVEEKCDLTFCSEREGFMHACAHDAHAAMLLGAAKILNNMKENIRGTVRLFFQPAEEDGTGAKAIIKQGALDGVDGCIGIHLFGCIPVGMVGTRVGPLTPFTDTLHIKINGKSSHGAMPNLGVDATLCASAFVMNVQSIVSREINPMTSAVVTVGSLHSGTAYNIVSGEAVMEGTVRLYDREVHGEIEAILRRILDNTCATYRCTGELDYIYGSHALVTDKHMTEITKKSAEKCIRGEEAIYECSPMMGGEDFAAYSEIVPSTFISIGCGGTVPNHNEHFLVDEASFPLGVAIHVQSALDFLNE